MSNLEPLVKLRRSLTTDRVSHLERSTLVKVAPTIPVREAMRLMCEHRCGCVLVCQGERLLGIFTERDVLTRVLTTGASLDTCVSDYMTPDPVTLRTDDTVGLVIKRMLSGGYRHLPIVNERGEPEGVVSVKGLIHFLAEHYPTTVYNLPPVPSQVQHSREGA